MRLQRRLYGIYTVLYPTTIFSRKLNLTLKIIIFPSVSRDHYAALPFAEILVT